MKIEMFSIHDSKAAAFVSPWFSPNEATAQRQFAAAANDPATDLYKFGEDYTLFHLGSFDQESGKFELLPTPRALGLAILYKRGRDAEAEIQEMVTGGNSFPGGGKKGKNYLNHPQHYDSPKSGGNTKGG